MKYLFFSLVFILPVSAHSQAQFGSDESVFPSTISPAGIEAAPLSIERSEIIDETLVLRGQIIEFDFTQPETRILLDAEFTQWELIAPSAVELRRLGWTSSSLFSGELVEAEVVRQLGTDNSASLKRLTRANGALLLTEINQPKPEGFESISGGMYSLDTDHANLEFAYNHLGFSNLEVEFERMNADVLWNAEIPESSIIQLNIDASSLRSGVSALDEVLRGAEFFDTFNHPRIQFRSTQVRLVKWGNLQIDGQLEIRGLNQPVRLEARLNKAGLNPITQEVTVGVSLTGNISRSNWGLSGYLDTVEDEIQIQFDGEFILRAADIPSVFPSDSGLSSDQAIEMPSNNSGIEMPRNRPLGKVKSEFIEGSYSPAE